jgi:hypothetical protein
MDLNSCSTWNTSVIFLRILNWSAWDKLLHSYFGKYSWVFQKNLTGLLHSRFISILDLRASSISGGDVSLNVKTAVLLSLEICRISSLLYYRKVSYRRWNYFCKRVFDYWKCWLESFYFIPDFVRIYVLRTIRIFEKINIIDQISSPLTSLVMLLAFNIFFSLTVNRW